MENFAELTKIHYKFAHKKLVEEKEERLKEAFSGYYSGTSCTSKHKNDCKCVDRLFNRVKEIELMYQTSTDKIKDLRIKITKESKEDIEEEDEYEYEYEEEEEEEEDGEDGEDGDGEDE